MSIFPMVGRGIGPVRMTWHGYEQIISTKPCETCDGSGWIHHDKWIEIEAEGIYSGRANFGHIAKCYSCDNCGDVVTAIYTRGLSLTPLIARKG